LHVAQAEFKREIAVARCDCGSWSAADGMIFGGTFLIAGFASGRFGFADITRGWPAV
jgi:hypothetical protein